MVEFSWKNSCKYEWQRFSKDQTMMVFSFQYQQWKNNVVDAHLINYAPPQLYDLSKKQSVAILSMMF